MNSVSEKDFIKSLNENQLKAMEIAKKHLKTSFDLQKSIGFKKFKEFSLKKDIPGKK